MKRKCVDKRITGLLLGTAMAVSSVMMPVYGADTAGAVEIQLNLGNPTLSINGQSVSVAAPFSVGQGTTMVPLRVITEAFGATVDWNANEKTISISYDQKSIQMQIDQKTAQIDGQTVDMTEAPVIQDGTTMVPLRFISENFGATVGFDENTKQVTVTKDKDINISNLLNVSDKAYIGDQYFGWSMKNSPSFSLTNRNLDASELSFTNDGDTCAISLAITTYASDTDYSMDKAILYTKESLKDYTLISQKKDKKDGVDYYEISAKESDGTAYSKLYWKNNRLYSFAAYITKDAEKKDADLTMDCFQSIALAYKDSGDIEDLSNTAESGTRKFEETKLNLSLDLPVTWEQEDNADKANYFEFVDVNPSGKKGEFYTRVVVQMYSRDGSQTVDEWAKEGADIARTWYNPEFYKQTTIAKKVGTYDSKGFKEETKPDGVSTLMTESYYIFGGKYKYQIVVSCDPKVYNDPTAWKAVEQVVNSFHFSEPDADEVGILTEPDSNTSADDKITDTVKLDDMGVSFDIPTLWTYLAVNAYGDASRGMSIVVGKNTGADTLTEQSLRDAVVANGGEVVKLSMSGTTLGGKNVIYVQFKNASTNTITDQYIYKNTDNTATLVTLSSDLWRYGERNKTLTSDIVKSFKFQ